MESDYSPRPVALVARPGPSAHIRSQVLSLPRGGVTPHEDHLNEGVVTKFLQGVFIAPTYIFGGSSTPNDPNDLKVVAKEETVKAEQVHVI